MPIDASPSGTLDIENATLRSRNIASLTNMVAGNDVIRGAAAPTLEVYGDPSHGGTEPTLELVSNTSNTVSTTFTRLTSNAGVFSIQSGTAGTADSKADITFASIGGNTEHMRIKGSTGRVGIGFTDPDAKLHVNGPVYKYWSLDAEGFVIWNSGGYNMGLKQGNRELEIFTKTPDGDGDIRFKPNNVQQMVIRDGGNVGIGEGNPLAKLHVTGVSGNFNTTNPYNGLNDGKASYMLYNSATVFTNTTGDFYGVSIYGNGDILAGSYIGSFGGYITASDSRIKKEIVDVEDGSALETLRLLKPKQYKYKDEVKRGSEPVWGFIAQEVRDTLPYATQLRTECLPNIYEMANVSVSNVITFTNFDTSDLESNAMVLKVFDKDDTEHLINITEVVDDHSVRVEEDLSEWTGYVDESGNVVAGNQLFVYGQRVNDFVFLRKESIWTVATSALQEVDRQLQAEKAKVASLEARVLALESA